LVWSSRILAAVGAITAIIGTAKWLGPEVSQYAALGTLVFYELARRCEQWLPKRLGKPEPEPEVKP